MRLKIIDRMTIYKGKDNMDNLRGINMVDCPYIKEANRMCNVLVSEVVEADTWAKMQDAIWAIQRIRSRAKKHIAEWEHLNNPPKLWLLRPVEPQPKNDNPWEFWQDKVFGFVIKARTEKEAREYAEAEAGDESLKNRAAWIKSKYSTCVPLDTDDVAEGVIITDYFASE